MKERLKKIKVKDYINYAIILFALIFLSISSYAGGLNKTNTGLVISMAINIILALSLNLCVGYLGELSLGHAGFMALGAYAGALFTINSSIPEPFNLILAIIMGGLVAAMAGVIVCAPVLRLKGDYVAIVTLAFGQIIVSTLRNVKFTGGALGLSSIPKLVTIPIAFLVVLVALFIVQNLIRSRHGRAIMAIRDNTIAARAGGINVTYYKAMVFGISAFLAGVAGVLYAHYLGSIEPTTFDYNKSIEILVIVVLGGMGSLTGSIIGAVIITGLPTWLYFLNDYRMLIYAVVLIVVMIFNASPRFAPLKEKLSFKNLIKTIIVSLQKKRYGYKMKEEKIPEEVDTGDGNTNGVVLSVNVGKGSDEIDNSGEKPTEK